MVARINARVLVFRATLRLPGYSKALVAAAPVGYAICNVAPYADQVVSLLAHV